MTLAKDGRVITVETDGAISALLSSGYTEYVEAEKPKEKKPTTKKSK